MSRFFRGAASDSDSSSGSESSDDEVPRPTIQPAKLQKRPVLALSDSEEETKRVVRRQKDKRFDELKDMIKEQRNKKKIKDMSKVLSLFEDLCKAYQKAKPVIDKEAGGRPPRFYLRYLVQLEEFVVENWEAKKEAKETLSKANSVSLTTLRGKLRRYIRDNDLEQEINEYKESPDPEGYESVEEEVVEEPSSESEEDEPQERYKQEGSDSEGEWSESSESSSESDIDIDSIDKEKLREFFLKPEFRKGGAGEKAKKPEKAKRTKEQKERRRLRKHSEESGEWEHIPASGAERQKVLFEKNVEINYENVINKLNELLASRGKKGTDPKQLVSLLKQLQEKSEGANLGPAMSMKILLSQISGMYEYQSKMYDCMGYSTWQEALEEIRGLLNLMKAHPEIHCGIEVQEENENLTDPTNPLVLHGSLLFIVERLDGEFTKILQEADCHSTDYVDKEHKFDEKFRLKGEKDICGLIEDCKDYMEKQGYKDGDLCRIYAKQIEHLYYKYDGTGKSKEEMEKLCQFIYTRDETKRLRTKAVLCHIYHQALHDRWHAARDLMLMSHLQGSIEHADALDQILHNRGVAQLGLCAFRCGMVKEAHSALSDLQNSGKAKELLAQGLTMRGQDKSPEQEKIERQRQVPYHMHINLELLECVYLICAMLLEIPQMASREHEMRRRMLSRSFHYQLKQSERSSLVGPPENTREHVVAASRAMLKGDWRAARDFVVNEKMNIKVWNLFHESDKVREMVVKRVQEESLRTYLLTYSTVYSTVSIDSLAEMFEMNKKAVHALMSKMIIQEELAGTLDEPAECLVMHRVEPSRMQLLSLQLTEKLNYLAENNEQILDPRSGQGMNMRPTSSNWFAQRQQGGRGDYGGGMGRQQGRKGGYNRGFGDSKRQQYGRRN